MVILMFASLFKRAEASTPITGANHHIVGRRYGRSTRRWPLKSNCSASETQRKL